MIRAVSSTVIFFAAVIFIVMALIAGESVLKMDNCRSHSVYELKVGLPVEFVLPAGEAPLRLSTLLIFDGQEGLESFNYEFQVEWIDSDMQTVDQKVFKETSKRDIHWASPRHGTQSRLTELSPGKLAETGGILRLKVLKVPEGMNSVFVRGLQRKKRSEIETIRLAVAPTSLLKQQAQQQIGIERWSELSYGEKIQLLEHEWSALLVRNRKINKSLVRICHSDLPERVVKDRILRLSPGRSVALNLVGPVNVRILGGKPVENLKWWTVPGPPQGESPEAIQPKEISKSLDIVQQGPFSLTVHNPMDEIVEFVVATSSHRAAFAGTLMVPAEKLNFPLGSRRGDWLVLPEYRTLKLPVTHGKDKPGVQYKIRGFEAWDQLQLVFRSYMNNKSESVNHIARIDLFDSQNKLLRSEEIEFTPGFSAFEKAPGNTSGLGEPESFYLNGLKDVAIISITTDQPGLVNLSAKGRHSGWEQIPQIESLWGSRLNLRYQRNYKSNWLSLTPANTDLLEKEGRLVNITAVVRFEAAVTEPLPENQRRSYQSLAPEGTAPSKLFLQPVDSSRENLTPVYCQFKSSETSGTFQLTGDFIREVSGNLLGQLWIPRQQLGSVFHVRLDKSPWVQGRVRQRVVKLRKKHFSDINRVHMNLPRGSLLWLRGIGGDDLCELPHRMVRGYLLRPGQSVEFKISKSQLLQMVSFGGFSNNDVRLGVKINNGFPGLKKGVSSRPVFARQILELKALPQKVWEVHRLFKSLTTLDNEAIMLGDALAEGEYILQVTNESSHSFYLRALLEGEQKSKPWKKHFGGKWIFEDQL